MIGLNINQETNDLTLDFQGRLEMVQGPEAIGQHTRQRLKTFEGEWFLDTTAGVPWLDEIMGKQFDPALGEAVVKLEILDTPGVVEITSFSISFEPVLRRLNIKDVEVRTTYDEEINI